MRFCFSRLVGDVLLCTGFLSYSGPFNQEFRDMLLTSWQKEMKWRKIPFTANLNITSMLVDSATVSKRAAFLLNLSYQNKDIFFFTFDSFFTFLQQHFTVWLAMARQFTKKPQGLWHLKCLSCFKLANKIIIIEISLIYKTFFRLSYLVDHSFCFFFKGGRMESPRTSEWWIVNSKRHHCYQGHPLSPSDRPSGPRQNLGQE